MTSISPSSTAGAPSRAPASRPVRPAPGGGGTRPSCDAGGSCPSPTRSAGAGWRSCSRLPRSSRGRSSSCACGSARRAPACPCAAAAGLAAPSERDVVVGSRAAEVGVLGLRAARNELRLAALGILAPAAELDGVGDHLDRLALRAVLRFPLSPLQAPVDGDRTTLREVLRAVLTLVAPDGDVEVVRLLRPLVGLVVL